MKLAYVLHLADNALILGHRISEWCGHGPILEQDIALTNTALDHIGRARSLYQYAAELANGLPKGQKEHVFTSVALQNIIGEDRQLTEDDLAYLRDGWDFRNVLLAEQPNGDWAWTVARSFFLDAFHFDYFGRLRESTDETLAAIAEKSLKEVTYHLKWSSEWVIRLGDGTDESHIRIEDAVKGLWMFTGELFTPAPWEPEVQKKDHLPDLAAIRDSWTSRIRDVLEQAALAVPADTWMQQGGKDGRHTEHLGFILAEMQYMQRTYPGMEW